MVLPVNIKYNCICFFQRCIKHKYTREIIETSDGGQLAIDWANLDGPNKLVLIVLPGVTGSSKGNYVTHSVEKARKAGCKAVVMNYRGIQVELKTPRTYCATNYEDLHLVVKLIHNRYKEHKIFAIGTSLGGIILGCYLGNMGKDCLISNALIVSAPMNIFHSYSELEKPYHHLTTHRLSLIGVRRYFRTHKKLFETYEECDYKTIVKCKSLRDFDAKLISKQFGYNSCDDYHRDACLDAKIPFIKVPTLFLNAGDDMFSPERAFPLNNIENNEYTAMVYTKYGGHISFCEGLIPIGCNYTCRLLTDYLNYVLNEENTSKENSNSECPLFY